MLTTAALALAGATALPAAAAQPDAASGRSLCAHPIARLRYTVPADRVEAFRDGVRSYWASMGLTLTSTTDGERVMQFDNGERGQFVAESGPGESYAELVDLYPACTGRMAVGQKAFWKGFDRHMRELGFLPRMGL